MIRPTRGVQYGRNIGQLGYSTGAMIIVMEFKAEPPVPGARISAFTIDDVTVLLPPQPSLTPQGRC